MSNVSARAFKITTIHEDTEHKSLAEPTTAVLSHRAYSDRCRSSLFELT